MKHRIYMEHVTVILILISIVLLTMNCKLMSRKRMISSRNMKDIENMD